MSRHVLSDVIGTSHVWLFKSTLTRHLVSQLYEPHFKGSVTIVDSTDC